MRAKVRLLADATRKYPRLHIKMETNSISSHMFLFLSTSRQTPISSSDTRHITPYVIVTFSPSYSFASKIIIHNNQNKFNTQFCRIFSFRIYKMTCFRIGSRSGCDFYFCKRAIDNPSYHRLLTRKEASTSVITIPTTPHGLSRLNKTAELYDKR